MFPEASKVIAVHSLGAAVFLLYCICLALFVAVHLKNKEYNLFQHALSDYDIGSTHRLFQVYVWIGNLGTLCLAAAFLFSAEPSLRGTIPVLIAAMVVCRIGLSLFKTDLEGRRMTLSGIVHYLFAVGSFALAYIVIARVDSSLLERALPTGVALAVRVYGRVLTAVLAGVCVTMFRLLRRFFALVERLYILSVLIWFMTMGAASAAIGGI